MTQDQKLKYRRESLFLRKLVLGIPAQASGKNHATANACGCSSRPASLVLYPTRGIKLGYAMTRRDVGMLCIFTTQTALRENAQPYRFWGLLGSCLAALVLPFGFSGSSSSLVFMP
jgi:hypothetical protein